MLLCILSFFVLPLLSLMGSELGTIIHSTAAYVKGSADRLDHFSLLVFFICGLTKQVARKNLSSLTCSNSGCLPMTRVRVRHYCSVVESFWIKSFN